MVCTAIVGLPGVRHILAATRPQKSSGTACRRVARLSDLPVGRPVSIPLVGRRNDAWTTYPDQPIANLWFIRRDDGSVAPAETRVDAFSSICPHLKCRVLMDGNREQFVCPCHRGAFDMSGEPVSEAKLGHHNPAPRALDAYECRVVPGERGEWWVEVTYPA